jgi:SecD/SecF fusion protein
MEKQKRWQFWLIVAVILLTLYNILPTIFYYSKPLHEPIDPERARAVASSAIERVNSLEPAAEEWLRAYSKLLGLEPASIQLDTKEPRLVRVTFDNAQDAAFFKSFLTPPTAAGALIPFVPAQLTLNPEQNDQPVNEVLVARQISVHLDPNQVDQLFSFATKFDAQGAPTALYRDVVYDRLMQLALGFGGNSRLAGQIQKAADSPSNKNNDDLLVSIARELVEGSRVLATHPSIAERWYASLAQGRSLQGQPLMDKLVLRMQELKNRLTTQRDDLQREQADLLAKGEFMGNEQQQRLSLTESQLRAVSVATDLIRQQMPAFARAQKPLTPQDVKTALSASKKTLDLTDPIERVDLKGSNPFIKALVIDWNSDKIALQFYPDIAVLRSQESSSEAGAYVRDKLNSLIFDDIARVDSLTDELIAPDGEGFAVALNTLTDSRSFLTFDLGYVAKLRSQQILEQLQEGWAPKHPDLVAAAYPLQKWETYRQLTPMQRRLGLVVYAPAVDDELPAEGFNTDSIYVIARGLNAIKQQYDDHPAAAGAAQFKEDFQQLNTLLQQYGFIGFAGDTAGVDQAFRQDYIFKLGDYYDNLVKATRENFVVKGSKRYAVLDFTDVEQRILAENRIQDRIQEDLLKWNEEYNAAQVDVDVTKHYLVPPPTQNVYWQNFLISFNKYFKGDDRKVLKWGLDLSGGKTVRIGLRDHTGRPVTNPDDLKQAVNELYTRINKMGVAERTIRIENSTIVLDFPGSQGTSASELVKASAMYFHVVNEKFTGNNPQLGSAVNQFLQGVWNEAVVTNRKDSESINTIARHHLGLDENDSELGIQPRSEHAALLYDSGLRIADPLQDPATNSFDDTLSSIAVLRGSDYLEWNGQTNPLMIVFHNYALEGSNLKDVQVGWDESKGHTLSFTVKSSYESQRTEATGSPRDDFYAWTSQFAEDRIVGTPKEAYGAGWRMAVILNERIITMPILNFALRDSGVITGRFTQREINRLAADLKAGSLSFTPRILSEQNISPELGMEERSKGIMASALALCVVFAAMIGYYRFGGIVASCAVLFNILIMWGVLQNIGAALTLPGIAGIILTIGMAVDANVLVFERVREEFKISGRIASAIQAGYRKAFSAIIDSNITTIIVALILIQFDSGPIKGFAVTLIIGIISSMFTALFMTRYFFAGWVQNPKNTQLSMAELIGNTNFDFLAQTRKAVIISLIAVAAGAWLFVDQRATIFGMDFTGGYALTLEVEESSGDKNPDKDYRVQAIDALMAQGATSNDFQVRQLSHPWQLRIQLGTTIEERGHPFYELPTELEGVFPYAYQHNPRIVWIVDALQKGGLIVPESQQMQLEQHWTAMSGQFSDTMRNSAIMGLTLALLAILIYITLRFEFKYAVAAVVGLLHDVLITFGVIALCHKLGLPVQIDLQVIGAIMTIVGYSLNDTIIVFDRIREDATIFRKLPFRAVINHAINVTLSRTLMTSGTTILVLLTLVMFGGQSIFAFAFVMTIGIIVGTLSSLFIAAPTMLYLHDREERMMQIEAKPRTS